MTQCIECEAEIPQGEDIYLSHEYLRMTGREQLAGWGYNTRMHHAHVECIERPELLDDKSHKQWTGIRLSLIERAATRNSEAATRLENAILERVDKIIGPSHPVNRPGV